MSIIKKFLCVKKLWEHIETKDLKNCSVKYASSHSSKYCFIMKLLFSINPMIANELPDTFLIKGINFYNKVTLKIC